MKILSTKTKPKTKPTRQSALTWLFSATASLRFLEPSITPLIRTISTDNSRFSRASVFAIGTALHLAFKTGQSHPSISISPPPPLEPSAILPHNWHLLPLSDLLTLSTSPRVKASRSAYKKITTLIAEKQSQLLLASTPETLV